MRWPERRGGIRTLSCGMGRSRPCGRWMWVKLHGAGVGSKERQGKLLQNWPSIRYVKVSRYDENDSGSAELITQPISVGPTNVPEKNARDPLKSPRVNVRVSLLIALPSPDIDRNRLSLDSAEDEDPDIPDMVMGSMVFTPFVTMPRRRTRTEGKKGEVKHIEDRSTGQDTEMRQAEWVRRGDKWLMEGLDDVDHDAAGKAG